jgi:hypothetical protein
MSTVATAAAASTLIALMTKVSDMAPVKDRRAACTRPPSPCATFSASLIERRAAAGAPAGIRCA